MSTRDDIPEPNAMLTVFVDADSCPTRIREIICRAAEKRPIIAHFVAARPIPLPKSPSVKFTEVPPGQDAADKRIVELAAEGDLIVTRDIPLAAELVELGHLVINDRGVKYDRENVRQRLSERDFMAELRAMGLESMKDRSFSNREIQDFAATFDRELTRLIRHTSA